MKPGRRINWHAIGLCVLAAGLAAAVFIFATAGSADDGAIGYQTIDGQSYPILPGESKRYEAELERFGGKFAVQTAKLDRWLSARWHGEQLGYTVGFLAIVGALACFAIEYLSAPPPGSAADGRDTQDDAPR